MATVLGGKLQFETSLDEVKASVMCHDTLSSILSSFYVTSNGLRIRNLVKNKQVQTLQGSKFKNTGLRLEQFLYSEHCSRTQMGS